MYDILKINKNELLPKSVKVISGIDYLNGLLPALTASMTQPFSGTWPINCQGLKG